MERHHWNNVELTSLLLQCHRQLWKAPAQPQHHQVCSVLSPSSLKNSLLQSEAHGSIGLEDVDLEDDNMFDSEVDDSGNAEFSLATPPPPHCDVPETLLGH